MPELPEVESVRRSLASRVLGRRLLGVEVRRPSVITGSRAPRALLVGARVARVERLGKSLAIVAHDGRSLAVHLGMSGRLLLADGASPAPSHTHLVWTLAPVRARSGATPARIFFVDPRRFGGLWTFPTFDDLARDRWSTLGPDALGADARTLAHRLAGSRRALKAALLDQSVIAGLGNIYADESLFRARLHPLRRCDTLTPSELGALARAVRATLAAALRAGGSTLADGQYVNALGNDGGYQRMHLVYARGGLPCARCASTLTRSTIAARTTVFCPSCQPLTPGRAPRPGARVSPAIAGRRDVVFHTS